MLGSTLSLGIAIAKVLLLALAQSNGPDIKALASMLGDAKDGVSAATALRRGRNAATVERALGEAVANSIQTELAGTRLGADLRSADPDPEVEAAVRIAADVVAGLVRSDHRHTSDDALVLALAYPNRLLGYVKEHGGGAARATLVPRRTESAFDQALEVACNIVSKLAPRADHTLPAALTELLHCADAQSARLEQIGIDVTNVGEEIARTRSSIETWGQVRVSPLVRAYWRTTVEPRAIADPARATERDEIASFVSDNGSWWWWQAQPWAGKTTLMADIAARPPVGAEVAAFFVSRNEAAAASLPYFLDAITPQLAAIAGDEMVRRPTTVVDSIQLFRELLELAGLSCGKRGTRVLLVVDGLDEDLGSPENSIARALPARLPAGVTVLVASRSNPSLPVPEGHPLDGSLNAHWLEPSPAAVAAKRQAAEEFARVWGAREAGYRLGKAILCLVTAARAPLTVDDLVGIIALLAPEAGIDHAAVTTLINHDAARVFLRRPNRRGQNTYQLGHDLLVAEVYRNLRSSLPNGPADPLSAWCDSVHTWVDEWREAGWPVEAPDYATTGYWSLLESIGDLGRMRALATDPARRRFLFASLGTDAQALTEIRTALYHQARSQEPDLVAMGRLAIHLDRLQRAIGGLPDELFKAWVARGQVDRALLIVDQITDPTSRTRALLAVFESIGSLPRGAADELVERALDLARGIPSPRGREAALAAIAGAVAERDEGRALRVCREIEDPERRAAAIRSVVIAVAETAPAHALQLADEVESPVFREEAIAAVAVAMAASDADQALRLARNIPNSQRRGTALGAVVGVIAERNQDQVLQIVRRHWSHLGRDAAAGEVVAALARANTESALNLARGIQDLAGREAAVGAVVAAMAEQDPERALQLAGDIHNPRRRQTALAAVVATVAKTDLDLALTLARRSWEPGDRAAGISEVVAAMAETDPRQSLELARGIGLPHKRAAALRAVAVAMARKDARRALRLTYEIRDPADRMKTFRDVVVAAAKEDPERTLKITREIQDPGEREVALRAVVAAAADSDPERALRIARGNYDGYRWQEGLRLLAVATAVVDLDTALQLTREITDLERRAAAERAVAVALAEVDPERALQLARGIRSSSWRTDAVSTVAVRLAESDPLAALQVSMGLKDPRVRAESLAAVVATVTASDPEWALQLARGIQDARGRAEALRAVVAVVAASDPERALHLTMGIQAEGSRAEALRAVAASFARSDPDRAIQLAQGADSPRRRTDATAAVVVSLAASDPERALELARGIHDSGRRADALAAVMVSLAVDDPGRSLELGGGIHDPRRRAAAIHGVIRKVAERDPQRAMELALSIRDSGRLATAIHEIVSTVANTDPARALEYARGIEDPGRRYAALGSVAFASAHLDPELAGLLLAELLEAGHWELAIEGLAEVNANAVEAIARECLNAFAPE